MTVPFHFIPPVAQPATLKAYRTVPAEPGSFIQNMVDAAVQNYRETNSNSALLKLGTALHIYADTWAHQGFSGFHWENNYAKVSDAVANLPSGMKEKSYVVMRALPNIGHATAGTAPDETALLFNIQYRNRSNAEIVQVRNNLENFLACAHRILDCLHRAKTGEPTAPQNVWQDLQNALICGFATDEHTSPAKLQRWWNKIPQINFQNVYNKASIYRDLFDLNTLSMPANLSVDEASSVLALDAAYLEWAINEQREGGDLLQNPVDEMEIRRQLEARRELLENTVFTPSQLFYEYNVYAHSIRQSVYTA